MGVLGVSISVKALLPEFNRAYSDAVPRPVFLRNVGGMPAGFISTYARPPRADLRNDKIFTNFF
jgi:hypothetical protein